MGQCKMFQGFDLCSELFLQRLAPANLEISFSLIIEHIVDNALRLGCLYKFHDKPMTYLYNTLHYYEAVLRERAGLRYRYFYIPISKVFNMKLVPYRTGN